MYYIYPDIYYFYIALPSFLMFQYISSSIISLLSKKLPLAIFRINLLAVNFLAFPSSENAFVSSSLMKAVFCWIQNSGLTSFLLALQNCCATVDAIVSGVKSSHSNNHSPIGNMLFFSGVFQVFSLPLEVCFQKFDYDLCVDFFFFFFSLSCLGLLDSFCLLPNLEIFHPLLFSAPHSFSTSAGIPMTCMLDLFFLFHRSLKSYVSLSSIFFNCYLDCIISINLSSTSLILSPVISILLLRPSIEFFILVIILALL